MKRKLLALGATLIMVLGITACSAPDSVEEYYTQPEVQESVHAQIETMKSDYSGLYSDIGYTVEDNTFTYWFKFAEQIEDVDSAAEQLKNSSSQEMLADIVSNVEKECGISGITGAYVYYNADGSVIFEDSYTSTPES